MIYAACLDFTSLPFTASSIDENGRLIVDTSFRVKDHQNIFAIGDCTNLEEPKVGALAVEHGKLLAKSIFNLDRGKDVCIYKPGGKLIHLFLK